MKKKLEMAEASPVKVKLEMDGKLETDTTKEEKVKEYFYVTDRDCDCGHV